MNIKKILSLLLCFVMLATTVITAVSCSDTNDPEKSSGKEEGKTEAIEAPPIFDDETPDYNGKEFRVYTSINAATTFLSSSNPMIEGDPDAESSNKVAMAVDNRNRSVEKLLNVDLTFEQVDQPWDAVPTDLEDKITTNMDEYDLMINDAYALVTISFKNLLYNISQTKYETYFDFSQDYWYDEYMDDIALHENYQFILAGDYFIDIIRSAHCLIYNKALYATTFNDAPTGIYDLVSDKEWTYQAWLDMITKAYVPYNESTGEKDLDNDTFGYLYSDMWGCMIPMLGSTGVNYMERGTDGYPTIALDVDRCSTVAEMLYNIFYNVGSGSVGDDRLLEVFAEGRALFVGYQRLGTLENETYLNTPEDAKAIIPYPMLKLEDGKYTTSTHDTAECGAIPRTIAPDSITFISAVLESLNFKTAELVIPEYYETSLKVKYASDVRAAEMIDIVHDNFGNVFQLTYDYLLGDFEKGIFFNTIWNGSYNVSSTLGKKKGAANVALGQKITEFKNLVKNDK